MRVDDRLTAGEGGEWMVSINPGTEAVLRGCGAGMKRDVAAAVEF